MRLYVRHLAKMLGRATDTIRRYEASGTLPPARRDPLNGYRYWTPGDLAGVTKQFGVPDAPNESKEMKVV